MAKRLDLVEQIFGRLLVIGFAYTKKGKSCWWCLSDCNDKPIIVAGADLTSNKTMSCGCYKRERISETQKDSKRSIESRRKVSETRIKLGLAKVENNPMYGKHHTEETRLKISETRKRLGIAKGENNSNYGKFGEKSSGWKGRACITVENQRIRLSSEIQKWRQKVFKRDSYTCQKCGDKTRDNLNAHHLWPFILYPRIRSKLWNGLTLCKDCHRRTFGKELEIAESWLINL